MNDELVIPEIMVVVYEIKQTQLIVREKRCCLSEKVCWKFFRGNNSIELTSIIDKTGKMFTESD